MDNPCIIWAMVVAVITHTGCGLRLQKFRVRPESVSVREGDDVTLRCVVENQQGKAQWTKDGFALGFERDVPGYPRYTYGGEASRGQHHLTITSVTLQEDGEYQCQVGPTDVTPPIWAAANVTVLLAPSSIVVEGWRAGAVLEVAAGARVSLKCLVSDARPPPTITWTKDGVKLDPAQVQFEAEGSTSPQRWNVRSRVELTVTADDHGSSLTCTASHPALKPSQTPLDASVTLSVLHPPGAPHITGYRTGEVLRAGERRTLSCRVRGGNPRPSVTWYRRGREVDTTALRDSMGSVNILEVVAMAAEDGVTYECRVNNDVMEGTLSANVTLTVYYTATSVSVAGPSHVSEGTAISLTCETTESNPPSTITWIVQGEVMEGTKEQVIRVNSGGWVTTSDLVRVVARELTEVLVECQAVNPAIHHAVKKARLITITKPAGPPMLEGGLHQEVVAGSLLELACSSAGGRPRPAVRLYKETQQLVTETEEEGPVTRATGQVMVRPSDNGAKVTCEVTSPASVVPLTTSARLSVLFAPWEVVGGSAPTTVEARQVVTATCVTSPSLPAAGVTWRSRDVTLDTPSVQYTRGEFGGTRTRSELRLRTTAADNGRVLTCAADNGLADPVYANVTLNVLHGPVWVSVPPARVDVVEGDDVTITAAAAANPSDTRYMWWRGGEAVLGIGGEEAERRMGGTGELQLGSVGRGVAGEYMVGAFTQRGSVNATFTINVQYVPEDVRVMERVEVGQGGNVSVRCTARGNPTPTLTWTRPHTLNTSIEEVVGGGVGAAVLRVYGATTNDTGRYLCRGSNNVGAAAPAVTKVVVEQGVTSDDEGGKVEAAWAGVGGIGRLECRVKAAPRPSFVWTRDDGLTLLNSGKYTIHEPKLEDGLVRWTSVVEVRNVSGRDYQVYRCTAKNHLGTHTVVVPLHPPARPPTPANFTVLGVGSESVTLGWRVISDGGPPEAFVIKLRPRWSHQYQYEDVAGGTTRSATVSGLTPGTEYFVSVQAVNQHGTSHYVSPPLAVTLLESTNLQDELQTTTTHHTDVAPAEGRDKALDGDPSRPPLTSKDLSTLPALAGTVTSEGAGARMPRLIILIMSLTGSALLILNISIIACFVKRRNNLRSIAASSSSKIVDHEGLENTPGTPNTIHTPTTPRSLNTITTSHKPPSPTSPYTRHTPTTTPHTPITQSPGHANGEVLLSLKLMSNALQNTGQTVRSDDDTELSTFIGAEDKTPHVIPFSTDGVIPTTSSVLVLNTASRKVTPGTKALPPDVTNTQESRKARRERTSPDEPSTPSLELPNFYKDTVIFPPEPDICSLTPSIYDNAPSLTATSSYDPSHDLSRRESEVSSCSSVDEESVCSSTSSVRVYSKGYVRPLPPRGPPSTKLYHTAPLPLHQENITQSTSQDKLNRPQGVASPVYLNVNNQNPKSQEQTAEEQRTRTLSHKHRSGHTFSTGVPSGYTTLGTRRRATPTTVPFATLQRQRHVNASTRHKHGSPRHTQASTATPASTICTCDALVNARRTVTFSEGDMDTPGRQYKHQQENSGSSGYSSSPNGAPTTHNDPQGPSSRVAQGRKLMGDDDAARTAERLGVIGSGDDEAAEDT